MLFLGGIQNGLKMVAEVEVSMAIGVIFIGKLTDYFEGIWVELADQGIMGKIPTINVDKAWLKMTPAVPPNIIIATNGHGFRKLLWFQQIGEGIYLHLKQGGWYAIG